MGTTFESDWECSRLKDEIEQLRQRVAELEKERDNWKQVAQNNHDRLVDVQVELELSDALQRDKVAKLTAERDELLDLVKYFINEVPMTSSQYEWCRQAIASVKEK